MDDQAIAYEIVNGPLRPRKRANLQRLSGQQLYPMIEFDDGTIYREQSKDMAATIRAGKLDTKRVMHGAPSLRARRDSNSRPSVP